MARRGRALDGAAWPRAPGATLSSPPPRGARLDRTIVITLASLLAAATGCAAFALHARAERLQAELDAVAIERPLDELWPVMRRVLAERGFALAGKDREAEGQDGFGLVELLSRARESEATPAGGRRLETGWGAGRVRYVAEAVPAEEAGAWRVRYTAIQEHLTDKGHDGFARRDPELELEVVRRLDPERAAAIAARVDPP